MKCVETPVHICLYYTVCHCPVSKCQHCSKACLLYFDNFFCLYSMSGVSYGWRMTCHSLMQCIVTQREAMKRSWYAWVLLVLPTSNQWIHAFSFSLVLIGVLVIATNNSEAGDVNWSYLYLKDEETSLSTYTFPRLNCLMWSSLANVQFFAQLSWTFRFSHFL